MRRGGPSHPIADTTVLVSRTTLTAGESSGWPHRPDAGEAGSDALCPQWLPGPPQSASWRLLLRPAGVWHTRYRTSARPGPCHDGSTYTGLPPEPLVPV